MGCKYISLLEILSNNRDRLTSILQNCLGDRYNNEVISLIESVDKARKDAEKDIGEIINRPIAIGEFFIKDRPSRLLAPEISNTLTVNGFTIPTADPFPNIELLVRPNAREIKCAISQSTELFNLTGMISFDRDCIAKDDVTFLLQELNLRCFPPLDREFPGWHFEPNGIQIEYLGSCIDDFFKELKQRQG